MRISTRRVVQASALLSVVAVAAACGSSTKNSSSTSATTSATAGSSGSSGGSGTSGASGGGAAQAPPGAPPIVIGGANFSESTLVANIYGGALRKAGWKVTVKSDLGPRETVQPALESGQLNLVIDYAGNLLSDYYDSAAGAMSPQATATALAPYLAKKGLKAANVSAAADSDAIAVNQQTASKYHLTSLTQLGAVAGKLTFGGPPECRTRITCLPGLKSDYGVTFKSTNTSLDAAGPETIAALKNNQIQVGRLDSSDPSIASDHFTVLDDPKHFQDAGNLLPEFSVKIDSPQLEAVLNQVSSTLTTSDLVQLNGEISSKQKSPASVAASYLSSKNLG